MTIEKKFFSKNSALKVYAPDDLSKKWFIHYYEGKKRVRKYGKINKKNTIQGRIKEAQALLDILNLSSTQGNDISDRMLTFLIDNQTRWRKKSYLNYKSRITYLINYLDGNVTVDNINEFFIHIKKTRSATTYNAYLQQIGAVLRGIGEEQLIKGIKKLKNITTPARYFNKHQVTELSAYISSNNPELWLFCQFIYYCFIRPGELRLLKVEDIIFDENKILIPGHISKNKKSEYVVIPQAFRANIQEVKKRKGRIFKVGINTMTTRHRNILKKLNYDTGCYKLYSWKHTGAVRAVQGGISLKHLQIQLRHHSLDQVNEYLRQMGVTDLDDLSNKFPSL